MSEAWKINTDDIRSALRHTVLPVLGGAFLAGWQVVEQGLQTGLWAIEWPQVVVAVKVSAVAGLGRLIHRWVVGGTPS